MLTHGGYIQSTVPRSAQTVCNEPHRAPRSGEGLYNYRHSETPHKRNPLIRRHRVPRPELPLDLPRDVHRAELRPAHRAELGALEVLRRQRFIVQLARPLRIERQPELLDPERARELHDEALP